ncbi:hypothetical protein K461DRAFT_111276 [Myriangium duriaei CBS 260.36]|uniref:Secreted protein n=1 Tax=Myriangium duriaei CBS 260.36 TaxID=1168546 RepID=A0A9P4J623_9PEZI|nr:hypothetical protein K461DRAFT_111276 [Myriangium duriaei CBS 260.36]
MSCRANVIHIQRKVVSCILAFLLILAARNLPAPNTPTICIFRPASWVSKVMVNCQDNEHSENEGTEKTRREEGRSDLTDHV